MCESGFTTLRRDVNGGWRSEEGGEKSEDGGQKPGALNYRDDIFRKKCHPK